MKIDGTNKQVATKKPATLSDWLMDHKDSLAAALPKNTVDIDRFMQSALLTIYNAKNPTLAKCTPESIYRSLKESAALGLEVGGILGQAYLIPYNESVNRGGKWVKEMTCHFQCGYKGLITLARRSNTIKTIACEPVYENDEFECQLGMDRKLSHKINIMKERGEVIGYYCLVELVNGGTQFKVMSKKDVEKHRDTFSKAYKKDDESNVWNRNFDAMALKTLAIQTLKLCPISVEALEAVRREEMAEVEEPATTSPVSKIDKESAEDVMYDVFSMDDTPDEKPEEPMKKAGMKKAAEIKQPEPEEPNMFDESDMAGMDQAFDYMDGMESPDPSSMF